MYRTIAATAPARLPGVPMSLWPSITIVAQMPRHRQTLSDQLVLGLVTGGLLGPGLYIEGRDSDCIRFRRHGGALQVAPDRGEISLASGLSGDTRVECRICCRGLALSRLLGGILLGAALAGLVAVSLWAFRLCPAARGQWAGASGLLVALLASGVGRWVDDRRLRRQVEAFLHNTTYLKAL